MSTGIYKIINTITNDIYIGSSIDIHKRWSVHKRLLKRNKHHSIYLQNSYNKYTESIFTYEILLICSEKDLLFYEQRALQSYKPAYNMALNTLAPMKGKFHSQEAKEKISNSLRGNKRTAGTILSKEHKIKISERLLGNKNSLGYTHSEQTKAKMSANTARNKPMLGKQFSEEHKAKLAIAATGRVLSDETKAKISVAKLGKTRKTKRHFKYKKALSK